MIWFYVKYIDNVLIKCELISVKFLMHTDFGKLQLSYYILWKKGGK